MTTKTETTLENAKTDSLNWLGFAAQSFAQSVKAASPKGLNHTDKLVVETVERLVTLAYDWYGNTTSLLTPGYVADAAAKLNYLAKGSRYAHCAFALTEAAESFVRWDYKGAKKASGRVLLATGLPQR